AGCTAAVPREPDRRASGGSRSGGQHLQREGALRRPPRWHRAARQLRCARERHMMFSCCDERRLEVLRRSGSKNAIEFLEVLDRSAPPGAPRQQTLLVRLLRAGFTLTPENLRISGGERIRTVSIAWASAANALPPQAEPQLVDGVDELDRTLV